MNTNIFKNIIDLIQTIILFFMMMYYIYENSLVLLLWSLGFYLFEMINLYFTKGEIDIFDKKKVDYSERDMFNNSLFETISNIKLVKSFGFEKREVKRLLSIFTKKQKIEKESFFLEIIKIFYKFIYNIIIQNKEIILLFITGKEIINGKMKYGDYLVFKTYFPKFKKSYQSIKNFIKILDENILSWKRFFEVYEYENKIISKKNIIPKEEIKGEIKFKNVTYPIKEKINILNNISFIIKPGKLTAIVGYSGSGKSTIINLIERFYDPKLGEI
jgi:ABC-type multidrug transport system fused ATPase/permease subunit